MRDVRSALAVLLCVGLAPIAALAQSAQAPMSVTVPRLVHINGNLPPTAGAPTGNVEEVTLGIYAEETGGAPLWQETQSVTVDASGRYSIMLGATQEGGVPLEVFASGEPRFLGMSWTRPGQADGGRVRLTSVPYALRASDADTLGGLPPSAFLRAGGSDGGSATAGAGTTTTTVLRDPTAAINTGTPNYIGKFVNAQDLTSSVLFENAGRIGLGTTSPLDMTHVQFTNTGGSLTGIAVQNLGNTATSYSGMLFYDHTGALGQFQGFNNSTKEYRINNIAPGGSINFMTGSTSRFKVAANGRIGIGVADPTFQLEVAGAIKTTQGDYTLGTGNYGTWWVDAAGAFQAHLFRWGFGNGALYITNAGGADLTGVYLLPGATSLTSSSDERLKRDITPVTGILDRIRNIRVVSFNMASLAVDPTSGKAVANHNVPARTTRDGTVIKQQIGSIAQDWMKEFPELVVEPQNDDEYYGLNYDRIGVVALGGVKELTTLVAEKDAEIEALKERLAALEQMLKQIKGQLGTATDPRQ